MPITHLLFPQQIFYLSIHRDLKFENILFVSDAPQAEIKLIDFGLSKRFAEEENMTEGTGTM